MAEDPERPNLIDFQIHRYQKSYLESTYTRDRGILVIPVMGPAGISPVVVRTHAPIGYREVNFDYMKQHQPPLMPAAADSRSGDLILGETRSFPAPITDPEGKLVFGTTGTFSYVQPAGGREEGDSFPIDSHPFPSRVDTLGFVPTVSVAANADERITGGGWNLGIVDTTLLSTYRLIA